MDNAWMALMNTKRTFRPLLISLACLTLLYASCGTYSGSIRSDKYHYHVCKWSMKINLENRVIFWEKFQAESAGYVACKVCRPGRGVFFIILVFGGTGAWLIQKRRRRTRVPVESTVRD